MSHSRRWNVGFVIAKTAPKLFWTGHRFSTVISPASLIGSAMIRPHHWGTCIVAASAMSTSTSRHHMPGTRQNFQNCRHLIECMHREPQNCTNRPKKCHGQCLVTRWKKAKPSSSKGKTAAAAATRRQQRGGSKEETKQATATLFTKQSLAEAVARHYL